MLQVQAGSIWIGQKVVERVVDMNQSTQKRSLCVRIHTDKVRVNLVFSLSLQSDHPPRPPMIARPLVVHGCHAVPHVLHSWPYLRLGHHVLGENADARHRLLCGLFPRQNDVRRPPDVVAAAQRLHGHQVLVLCDLGHVPGRLTLHAGQCLVLSVQRRAVAVLPPVVAWRSGNHSADQGAAFPGA